MNPEQKNRSASRRPGAVLPDGNRIDALAADWLARREAGLTAVERDALCAWLAADPRNAAAFARADAGRDEFDWPLHAGAIDDLLEGLAARARRRRRIAAASATVLLLALATWRWPHAAPPGGSPPPGHFAVVPPQSRILPDGTIIETMPGTEIAVDYAGDSRRVTLLRGTAHFQVAKDPERPFVVSASGHMVRAVGTAFMVELGAHAMTVVVTEGTVAVDDRTAGLDDVPAATPDASPPLPSHTLVDAGNSIVLDVSPRPARPAAARATSAAEVEQRLAWRLPRLEFSGVPLGEVVAMFNRHNRVQLVVADPSLARLKLSGALRADKVDALVRLLESDFQVMVERRETRIVLHPAPGSPRSN